VVEDDDPSTVPKVPSPDTTIAPSVAPTSPESSANPGISTTVQEHPETMLDVHPPLEALHTWKGFCIHIATIVIGLCIAVGLEQTVEYFHHRHQIAETREALRAEREGNIHAFAESVSEFHRQSAALINNIIVLRYLQQHPATQEAQLPGILVWHAIPGKYSDSAWRTAQQSNVTALMPQDEVRRYAALYAHIEDVANAFAGVWPTVVRARLYSIFDPDPTHLSHAQVDDEIALTQTALASQFAEAGVLVQLGRIDPGFSSAPTKDELNSLMRLTETERDPNLAEAIAITNQRLPADSQLPMPKRAPKAESPPPQSR
jgi:hypothetical protein